MTRLWLLLSLVSACYCYENVDFEIYDLYEEVNGTFYELLNVTQEATVSEIRRAYRKLSLTLHPDKNKAPNAEEQFRQLVAVYEILKDKEKREKYEDVLKNGLPDWRNPIYYYRKYRKMGNLEVSIIVALIATIGHYLTWWVAYLEKKFEMDEVLAPIRKRREKKKAKGKLTQKEQEEMDTDELLEKELGYRRPTLWDFLPFVIYRFIYGSITSIPSRIREAKERRRQEKERKQREEEEEKEVAEAEAAKLNRPKRVKPQVVLRDASEFADEKDFVLTRNENGGNEYEIPSRKNTEWFEEDYPALAKSMAKFPGGTPGRWERIAHELGRSADEVTKKVKSMKEELAKASKKPGTDLLITKKNQAVNLSDSLVTKAIDAEIQHVKFIKDDDLYQSQFDVPDNYDEGVSEPENIEPQIDYTIVKKKLKTRPVDETKTKPVDEAKTDITAEETSSQAPPANTTTTVNDTGDAWTQVQQKCLEAAIAQFPKSTTDRWVCIARAVPDKTKEHCITRYKLLAEHVKQRKTKQGKGS